MSRKHFIAIAHALLVNKASIELVSAIADVCQSTNPNFDRPRFIRAATQVE